MFELCTQSISHTMSLTASHSMRKNAEQTSIPNVYMHPSYPMLTSCSFGSLSYVPIHPDKSIICFRKNTYVCDGQIYLFIFIILYIIFLEFCCIFLGESRSYAILIQSKDLIIYCSYVHMPLSPNYGLCGKSSDLKRNTIRFLSILLS